MKSRNVAMQVLVLSYSIFGIIGITSSFLAPSPITYAISAGLEIFAYSSIAVLSKRLTFRELFSVLMPLSAINIIRSYVNYGFIYIKYKPFFDQAFSYVDTVLQASRDNVTVTDEYLNETFGSSLLNISIPTLPYSDNVTNFVNNLPNWIFFIVVIVVFFYTGFDLLMKFITNIFSAITIPIIYFLGCILAVFGIIPSIHILYVVWLWTPIAATVDTFLRIYILRGIFFRLFRNHPLIKNYA